MPLTTFIIIMINHSKSIYEFSLHNLRIDCLFYENVQQWHVNSQLHASNFLSLHTAHKVQKWPNNKQSINGSQFKESGYFKEEVVMTNDTKQSQHMYHSTVTCQQPLENNDKMNGSVVKMTMHFHVYNTWHSYLIHFATLYGQIMGWKAVNPELNNMTQQQISGSEAAIAVWKSASKH